MTFWDAAAKAAADIDTDDAVLQCDTCDGTYLAYDPNREQPCPTGDGGTLKWTGEWSSGAAS